AARSPRARQRRARSASESAWSPRGPLGNSGAAARPHPDQRAPEASRMIATTAGRDVRRLLDAVRCRPQSASQLVICSPFVDPELLPLVGELADRTGRAGCAFRVITREPAATM